jgi:hypothetical protein
MERNEELAYGRGDVLYMAGATIAAIGDSLGHMWARYLEKDFWDVELRKPEVVEARAEWLKEAYKLVKEDDRKGFKELLEEGSKVLPELGDESPFYLVGRPAERIYDLVAVIGHSTSAEVRYLDLVMHVDPIVREVRDAWLDWKEGGGGPCRVKEPLPPPFSDEAKRALKEGALGFLVGHTYDPYYFDYPGIRRPDVSVKYTWKYEEYGVWGGLKEPPVLHADAVERNIWHLRYEHTTETGRGEFSVIYGDGVYDFNLRVVRGGAYAGLTAIETHVRIVEKNPEAKLSDVLLHQITPLAEERHYLFAANELWSIGRNIERYAMDLPYQIDPAAEKIKTLAEIIGEEYEAKFGPLSERDDHDFERWL